MTTVIKTSYRDGGAASLIAYIGRDGNEIKDRAGQQLSIGEQSDFVEQSESNEFEREMIVSPEKGEELTEGELELRTRQSMREFCADRPSARYVYAVHNDSDHVHAHVAMTGTREDLYMDRQDIRQVRERCNVRFRNAEREALREPSIENEAEAEAERSRTRVDTDQRVDDLELSSGLSADEWGRDSGPDR